MEEKKSQDSLRSFGMFVAKAVVIAILLALFLDAFLPDFSEIKSDLSQQKSAFKERLVKTFANERSKLYILSFVQNPAALYRASEIAEREGRLDSAIRDMDLAIGLLEMHSAEKSVIKRYNDRLDKLKVMAKIKN